MIMKYKIWDMVMLSLTTNHMAYPQKVKEAIMRDNIVRVMSSGNGGCNVRINGYGLFYVYADEILWLATPVALFI